LQTKLDKLLQTKEKRQAAFEKAKEELAAVSKEVDSVKFKLFEILQSGSDDATFSNWAKRKIGESEKSAKTENANSAKSENGNYSKSEKPEQTEKPLQQNHQQQTGQQNQSPTQQNHPSKTGQGNQGHNRQS
jgi:hypothetical protein